MPTRELLAPSQRAQFTDFTAPLDDRTLARLYTLSANELEPQLAPTPAAHQAGPAASWEVNTFGQPVRVFEIPQHQRVAFDVARPQRQNLADTGASRPQHAHQQPITLGGPRGDDRLDILWRHSFGRLPASRLRPDRTRSYRSTRQNTRFDDS